MLYIQPSDFVAKGGATLGDFSAALHISGGNGTATLKANGLIFDIPNITPDRIELANSVIFRGYEALRTEFSELEIGSIEANAGHHMEIIGDQTAQDFLGAGDSLKPPSVVDKFGDVVVEPGKRFRLVSKIGEWAVRTTIEKSELIENGIFLYREIIVSDLSNCETTQQQFDLIDQIDNVVLEFADLKFEA